MRERHAPTMLSGTSRAVAPLHPFVDLHLHALPGVDNGPASWSAAIELCVQAAHNGITHAVLTPHFRGKPYAERVARLSTRLIRLREALVDRGLAMEVALAGECRFDTFLHQAIQSYQPADTYRIFRVPPLGASSGGQGGGRTCWP